MMVMATPSQRQEGGNMSQFSYHFAFQQHGQSYNHHRHHQHQHHQQQQPVQYTQLPTHTGYYLQSGVGQGQQQQQQPSFLASGYQSHLFYAQQQSQGFGVGQPGQSGNSVVGYTPVHFQHPGAPPSHHHQQQQQQPTPQQTYQAILAQQQQRQQQQQQYQHSVQFYQQLQERQQQHQQHDQQQQQQQQLLIFGRPQETPTIPSDATVF